MEMPLFIIHILAQVNPISSLDPAGPVADNIAQLWQVMFFFGTLIFVLVLSLMGYGIVANRSTSNLDEKSGNQWIILGGIFMPGIVLTIIFGFTIHTSLLTDTISDEGALTIEITGHRWWWEVTYPDQGVTTANEINLPVGRPIVLRLTSADVIHSFWVPQLGGKMDLIPGRENVLKLQADEAGTYGGLCAEYCGLQHAKMQFLVIAQEQVDFDQWVSGQQQPAASPENDLTMQGQDVFLTSGCVYCHNVEGLDTGDIDRSEIDLGPDLTHLASRSSIGAAILTNNRGNLGGWIANPHGIKPGVLMPSTDLSGEDLQALLAYLESLQ